MSRYILGGINVHRDLTDEEQVELGNYYDIEDAVEYDSDSSSNFEPDGDESDFDEPRTENNVLHDVRWTEMQRYIESDGVVSQQEDVQMNPDEAIESNLGAKYMGQGNGDKTVWWSMPSANEIKRTNDLKAKRERAFAKCTQTFNEKTDAFMSIFPPTIIDEIVIETNKKARRTLKNQPKDQPKNSETWEDTDEEELYAYIGVLLYAGAEKSNAVDAKDLFHKSNMPFYRAVMPLGRFEQLSRFIRFDDSKTRVTRLEIDKLAPMRFIWNRFQRSLKLNYVPSRELCTDEQLLMTQAKCSFRQYVPSRPGKYGIKIFWLVDSTTSYPLSAEVYLGTQPKANQSKGFAHDLVLRLSRDILDFGSNITMDSFFTSYGLALALAEKNTTLVGTIALNKRELPKVFSSVKEARERAPNSSVFCYSNACELVSYTTHTWRNVVLLSTAHTTDKVNEETGKPVIVHDYNKHKGGVELFNKTLLHYTCKRKSNRWPMLFFYNMLDVAAFAAFRLYELSHPDWNIEKQGRRKIFLKELAHGLVKKQLKKRCKYPVKSSVMMAMDLIGYRTPSMLTRSYMPTIQGNNSWRKCKYCKVRIKNNKSSASCDCLKPTCPLHFVRSCEFCYIQNYHDPFTDSDDDEDDDLDPNMPSTSRQSQPKRQRQSN